MTDNLPTHIQTFIYSEPYRDKNGNIRIDARLGELIEIIYGKEAPTD